MTTSLPPATASEPPPDGASEPPRGGLAAVAWPPSAASRVAGGLYDPRFEHDACGIALVADLRGRPSHALVERGLRALEHLAHRGATGSEEDSGDGAGILVQIPHRFLAGATAFDLPEPGGYATGIAFLPQDGSEASVLEDRFGEIAGEEGLSVLGWRDVPVDPALLGSVARGEMPRMRQVFVAPAPGVEPPGGGALGIDRLAFVARKRAEHESGPIYFASLSARTITYKGMLTSHQLVEFFPDLTDPHFESTLALVHSRFSTNTFPSWPLAHPYRYLAHNGEINTVAGNRNWMRAREALLASPLLPGLERAFP
ncbi:MAG: glutamate synthase subunit alpha, partial [Acidimicrobiales bacterium]